MEPVPVPDLSAEVRRAVLADGDLAIEGRLVDASNGTFLATACLDGVSVSCVYKPTRGERPLWDFPNGTLGRREVAAYEVSATAGWHCVPLTVWRDDGPMGPGMAQAWVTVDEETAVVDVVSQGDVPPGWRAVVDAYGERGRPVTLVHADTLDVMRMAVFDAVVNNADRKGGHVLVEVGTGDVFGVDHGLTFHDEDKLRTVLWGWSGEPLPAGLVAEIEVLRDHLDADLGERLEHLLSRHEVAVTRRRVRRLLRGGTFPVPGDGWPALPWPAF